MAESAIATLKPAASTGSLVQPNRDVEVIPSPQIPAPQHAVFLARNCGNGAAKATDQRVIVMSGTNVRVRKAPRAAGSGLVKPAASRRSAEHAKTRFALEPGHDEGVK
ncbi:hypothetical protein ACE10Z_07350 [Bradyrhizobium sp. Pha-3]|uniref:hypothetical protein n=1 Tax=Bradyrhizobium sp. Pha-3 TaxID=208375 RepID=UPI0035D505F6